VRRDRTSLDQELVVLGIELGHGDVLAGERFYRLERLPQRDDGELGSVVMVTAQDVDRDVARRPGIVRDRPVMEELGVGVGLAPSG